MKDFSSSLGAAVLISVVAIVPAAHSSHAESPEPSLKLPWADSEIEFVESAAGGAEQHDALQLSWPPGRLPHCLSSVSAFEFFPWNGTDAYTSEIDYRYFSGGSISSLVSTLDTTTLPDGAQLVEVCGYYRDSSSTADFGLAMVRVSADKTGWRSLQIPISENLSSGTPGDGYGCVDVSMNTKRLFDQDGDGDLDAAFYYLVVGPFSTGAFPTDGSIAVRQIWLRWTPPEGWTGPCMQ